MSLASNHGVRRLSRRNGFPALIPAVVGATCALRAARARETLPGRAAGRRAASHHVHHQIADREHVEAARLIVLASTVRIWYCDTYPPE